MNNNIWRKKNYHRISSTAAFTGELLFGPVQALRSGDTVHPASTPKLTQHIANWSNWHHELNVHLLNVLSATSPSRCHKKTLLWGTPTFFNSSHLILLSSGTLWGFCWRLSKNIEYRSYLDKIWVPATWMCSLCSCEKTGDLHWTSDPNSSHEINNLGIWLPGYKSRQHPLSWISLSYLELPRWIVQLPGFYSVPCDSHVWKPT